MSETTDGAPARVTIRDVARAANVHISTVSRALDPTKNSLIGADTRDRVLAVAEELGYRPHLVASGLRRGQTLTVGVVVPDLGNPIYAPMVRGVTHALGGEGYMPLVADTEDEHERFDRVLRHLTERRVEAIIAAAGRVGEEELLVRVAGHGVPVITAVRTLPASGLPLVHHDDAEGARLAAAHLLELGHTRFAQVPGPADVEPFRARDEAFAAAVEAGGGRIVARCEPAPHPVVEEGEARMTSLLRDPAIRPTAVFVQNDTMALGALEAVRALGLTCPDDVSVVSYNDAFFAAHTDPPLTSVRLAAYEIGRQAGLMALEMIEHRGEVPPHPVVRPELVVRRSSGPPR